MGTRAERSDVRVMKDRRQWSAASDSIAEAEFHDMALADHNAFCT